MGGEEVLSQFTSSAVVVYALELLKRAGWCKWVTAESKTLNRWLAVLGSGVAALGVHFAFDIQQGQLVISGLTVAGVLHGAWHWLQQYAITQLAYDAAVAKKG